MKVACQLLNAIYEITSAFLEKVFVLLKKKMYLCRVNTTFCINPLNV